MGQLMGVWSRVKSALLGITWGVPGADTWAEATAFNLGLDLPTGQDGLARPYAQHPTIASAMSIVAEDAASIPWQLVRKQGSMLTDEVIDNHPVLDLLRMPMQNMSQHDLWVQTYTHALLDGEWFWYMPDVTLAQPDAPAAAQRINTLGEGINILPPMLVKTKVENDSTISWWLDQGGGVQPMRLDVDFLVHWKRYNPYNPLRGLSLMEALRTEIVGDHNAARWNRSFFGDQNGMPGGLLKPGPGGNLSPDQRAEMLRTWNQRHGQKRTVGMLPAGWDFLDLGKAQKEMDFKSLREYARELALGSIGLPPFMAGVLDKANYANARKQEEVYWQGTIKRFKKAQQSTLNSRLLPMLGVEDVALKPAFDEVNALLEDLNDKTEVADRLFKMGFTRRQINERLQLGFDEDTLVDPDEAYLPAGMRPVSTIDLDMTPPEPVEGEDGNGETRQHPAPLGPERELRRATIWRNLVDRTRDLEAAMNKTIRRHFHEIEREAVENLEGLKGWRLKQTPPDEGAFAIVDWDAAKAKLKRVTEPIFRRIMRRGGNSVIADLGLGISFDLDSPLARALLTTLTGQITRIDDTLETMLRASLEEGVIASETIDQLRDRVSSTIDASLGRARTIARTEVGRSFNGARNVQMRDAGIVEHEWLSSRDPDVRDTHTIDEERVPIGQPFSNGLLYPNDPAGPAGEVINCRCVALPVVEI